MVKTRISAMPGRLGEPYTRCRLAIGGLHAEAREIAGALTQPPECPKRALCNETQIRTVFQPEIQSIPKSRRFAFAELRKVFANEWHIAAPAPFDTLIYVTACTKLIVARTVCVRFTQTY